ncbi:DUF6155 family protein [Bacillus shivajii]|uniref:DUF6155 family protein n=1 Tax=Bacillus shivajii TaxID=1983719 RepID=UPI001CFBB11C|nr:DUF6155 family protein [Bacillus shivajii]UCZ54000.1 DUF6155 family protein [Bacillus shivajii]
MSTLKIPELKKELKELDKKELIKLITELYKLNKDVKQFVSLKYNREELVNELYEEAKVKIENEFFPERSMPKLRLKEAKNAINRFKKLTEDEFKTLDLMLFYVENGVEFTVSFGDIDENFYGSMVNMYDHVVDKCIDNENYYQTFAKRLEDVVEDTGGVGWGFHDALTDIYYSIPYIMEDNP